MAAQCKYILLQPDRWEYDEVSPGETRTDIWRWLISHLTPITSYASVSVKSETNITAQLYCHWILEQKQNKETHKRNNSNQQFRYVVAFPHPCLFADGIQMTPRVAKSLWACIWAYMSLYEAWARIPGNSPVTNVRLQLSRVCVKSFTSPRYASQLPNPLSTNALPCPFPDTPNVSTQALTLLKC